MKNSGARPFFTIFIFFFGSIALLGQTKVVSRAQSQKPPASKPPCADVAVVSFTATLASTEVGGKSVEFPHDTVRLDATLANNGTLDISRSTSYHIELSRNGEVIYKRDQLELLRGPGSRWTLHQFDTFPHNLKTTYTISVTTALAECRKDNNQTTFTIDETKLHPAKVNLPPKAAAKTPIKKP